jgi:hypothetical protein
MNHPLRNQIITSSLPIIAPDNRHNRREIVFHTKTISRMKTEVGLFEILNDHTVRLHSPIVDQSLISQLSSSSFPEFRLQSVIFSSTVEIISSKAFLNCPHLIEVLFELPSLLRQIGDNAFQQTSLTTITIPITVQMIGTEAFFDCSHLTTVIFPEHSVLAHLGNSAFKNTALTSFSIPSSVGYLGESLCYLRLAVR